MLKGFYFVTDSTLSKRGIINDVKEAVLAGVCAVQYRNKDASYKAMLKEALSLRKICLKIPLIINDYIDIAQAVNADGVHLGQSDMPVSLARKILGAGKIVGVTVHSLKEAEEAKRSGADYLGVAPIFPTRTKTDTGRPVGLNLISRIKDRLDIPIVAIGGINLSNAKKVVKAGADAICAISAVLKRDDFAKEIKRFQKFFVL
jgi:thiamine-phosphate pyrophosphorylase